jgi:hypothetical protein
MEKSYRLKVQIFEIYPEKIFEGSVKITEIFGKRNSVIPSQNKPKFEKR